MTTSPSSGLSPEAKEFVPLGQNSMLSIPLYVDEHTVASIYPSDQQPLMIQTIYPMMVTNSKVTGDNLQFPEIEFHIQSSQQQQFHIDSCANISQTSSINGSSTSQIVLLPTTTNSATTMTPTGYYSGPQIIYSTNDSVSTFYPMDYCEQPLISFSMQQPTHITKNNRILSQQQRPSSFRQPYELNHSTYRPSFRGGNRGSGNTTNRNSYYDYNNRRNGSSYASNSGRGNSANSKRISSSYHSHDYNNYYHSASRSRGYSPRSSQQQHDEYRKDNFDYYNHEYDYGQSNQMNDDGTPFEFRQEDFPSLPMNNQPSDNKSSSTTIITIKPPSSWNEIVSAPRRRSTSPQSIPPSQDQRSDRSRSFNNKLSSNNERKLSTKKPNLQPTPTKSPNGASKSNSHDEQPRSSSLTNSEPPIIDNNTKDDGFIQTKHQHRRLKRRNRLKEEFTSFPEQFTDMESVPYALDDENAFPILGQHITTPTSTSEMLHASNSKTHQNSLPDMFKELSTSTQVKPQNSHCKTSTTTGNSATTLDSKAMPKREKDHEQPKTRKATKTKRLNNKEIEENQNQPLQSISKVIIDKQSDGKDIQNETDTNTANVIEEEHQNSHTLSSSSSNSSDTSDYDDAVDQFE